MIGSGLGRHAAFDERSLAFGITDIETRPPRSYSWAGAANVLDQGREGACVGFSWAGELGARPVVLSADDDRGRELYLEARAVDQAEGRYWPEGASVLAGAKAVRAAGHMDSYRWAFGADQLATAVSWTGPAVIGISWHEAMYRPDPDGTIHPDGNIVGGHALIVRAYSLRLRRFTLRNSWGAGYGLRGDCYLSHADMAALLADAGDACVPIRRRDARRRFDRPRALTRGSRFSALT